MKTAINRLFRREQVVNRSERSETPGSNPLDDLRNERQM
jgi:hypothetical protein